MVRRIEKEGKETREESKEGRCRKDGEKVLILASIIVSESVDIFVYLYREE